MCRTLAGPQDACENYAEIYQQEAQRCQTEDDGREDEADWLFHEAASVAEVGPSDFAFLCEQEICGKSDGSRADLTDENGFMADDGGERARLIL